MEDEGRSQQDRFLKGSDLTQTLESEDEYFMEAREETIMD